MPKPMVAEPVTESETSLCPQYKVLLHNDPITPMDVVMFVLMTVFRLETEKAYKIMMEAHESEVALIVIEPFERAEFHVEQVQSLARGRGFPLTCSIEPA